MPSDFNTKPFMKIASWNVNSLNVRLSHVEEWLKLRQPDVVVLQETKMEDHKFPDDALASLGYRSVFVGQKTYNGVAILSKVSAKEEQVGFPVSTTSKNALSRLR